MITILFWIISVICALFISFLITGLISNVFVRHGAYNLWIFAILVISCSLLWIEYNYLPNHKPVYPKVSLISF